MRGQRLSGVGQRRGGEGEGGPGLIEKGKVRSAGKRNVKEKVG